MKITYIENIRFPSERAHALQIFHTCQELGRLGHEVCLVTPERKQRRTLSQVLGLSSDPNLSFAHVVLPSVDWLFARFFPRRLAYYLQRFTFFQTCKRWKEGRTSEIWYTRDPFVVAHLGLSSERWVLELHTVPSRYMWDRVSTRVREFVVISRALEEWLRAQGVESSRICLAADGYDPDVFKTPSSRHALREKYGWAQDEVVFVYTGGLFPWKGVDRLVEWWPLSSKGRSRLVIVGGEVSDRARIQARVKTSGIEFVPPVSSRAVAEYLMAADIGVLPTSPDYEIGRLYTSPLKLFEYLGAGLPILASDVPSSREVLDESRAVFFNDQASLRAAVVQALSDVWRRSASASAISLAASCTWKSRAERIQAFLLRRTSRPAG